MTAVAKRRAWMSDALANSNKSELFQGVHEDYVGNVLDEIWPSIQ